MPSVMIHADAPVPFVVPEFSMPRFKTDNSRCTLSAEVGR